MATYSWNTKIRHDSDANFRLWGQEIQTALLAVGCTQTADTGQINWTTVTRAATNTDAGYETYYINDSLHSTAPTYFKLYYGTGSTANAPRLRIEVGTGTNGSGTITGGNTVGLAGASGTAFATDTTYPSYCGLANGCLVLATKIGRISANIAVFGFVIARTCDSTGAANADGIMLLKATGATSSGMTMQTCRYATPSAGWLTSVGGGSFGVLGQFPITEATTVDENGANQMMLVLAQCLRVRPWSTLAVYKTAELTALSSVSGLALVGSTTYTFLALDLAFGYAVSTQTSTGSSAHGLAVVYQ